MYLRARRCRVGFGRLRRRRRRFLLGALFGSFLRLAFGRFLGFAFLAFRGFPFGTFRGFSGLPLVVFFDPRGRFDSRRRRSRGRENRGGAQDRSKRVAY
jgi:hypothetical protein